jgi:uncharacterized protein with PIN domain
MLGLDTLWFNDVGDAALARLAGEECRILLTRDRALLMRLAVTHGCYLRPGSAEGQLAYLVERLQLCAEIAPFSRCLECNGTLAPVEPAALAGEVPSAVLARHRRFWRCTACGRPYWKGSHWAAMRRRIEGICPGALGPGEP